MKRIPLTQGQFAIVDDEDYERINANKWYAHLDRTTNSYYAVRSSPRDENGKRHTIRMHREVMSAQDDEQVDHINHDTLDQRKENLRICSVSQNCANQGTRSNNKSGYKGVSMLKQTCTWRAYVQVNGKKKHIGYFATALDAALAYDRTATERYGEFAMTNKMLGLLKD